MANVFISVPMRKFTGGTSEVSVPGGSIRELVENLEARYPGIKDRLVEGGRLRPGLSAVVDGRATRRGLLQKIEEDSEVHFLPAIAGGSGLSQTSIIVRAQPRGAPPGVALGWYRPAHH